MYHETYENQNLFTNFQKITKYLLYLETKIIIDFLFQDSPSIIVQLYNHLNNATILNILENPQIYISDFDADYKNF